MLDHGTRGWSSCYSVRKLVSIMWSAGHQCDCGALLDRGVVTHLCCHCPRLVFDWRLSHGPTVQLDGTFPSACVTTNAHPPYLLPPPHHTYFSLYSFTYSSSTAWPSLLLNHGEFTSVYIVHCLPPITHSHGGPLRHDRIEPQN